MSETIDVVFIFLVLAMLVFVIILICFQLYQIFEEPGMQKDMKKLRPQAQPWVTVLLYARNDERTIEDSLRSIIKNQYTAFDVVVIDDRSTDTTLLKVQNFIKRHPAKHVAVIKRRVKRSCRQALAAGYRKSKRGKIVISIQAGTLFPSTFLKRAVVMKGSKTQLSLPVRPPIATNSLSEIITALGTVLWQQSYTVWVSDAKNMRMPARPIRYDVFAIGILLSLFLVSGLAQEATVLWYGWVLITGYLVAVIWLHEEKVATKLKLTFSAIPALFLLPVAGFIMNIPQFRYRN